MGTKKKLIKCLTGIQIRIILYYIKRLHEYIIIMKIDIVR